jgi:vesicle-associated membrane protein 7
MTAKGSFSYALVAVNRVPVAEFPPATSSNSQIVTSILMQINSRAGRLSAEHGSNVYSAFTDQDGLTFLCCSDRSVDSASRTTFLNDIQREWRLKYGSRAVRFTSHDKDSEFGPTIGTLLKSYNDDMSKGLKKVRANLEDAQTAMSHNMELAMTRGATLNEMEGQVNDISEAADAYHRDAVALRRKMCWDRYKWWLMGGGLVFVIVLIVVLVWYFKSRGSDDKSEDNGE